MAKTKRRAVRVEIRQHLQGQAVALSSEELRAFEELDRLYRATCALLYNYAPTSGHPGGSISSGRMVAALLFDTLDYDLSEPDRLDADIVSYAAGHKALGLYAMWALRNEVARAVTPDLLPKDIRHQLRLEDLLGFRRNPVTRSPLFRAHRSKPLDGHPTPATPFVRLATGASGVGLGSSIGLALAARDVYGDDAPRVHVIEGEGGLTPGRVAEALAMAGTASLGNVVLHVDWNQASIDSNRVCHDGGQPGDYVQWSPSELCAINDWNVIDVADGHDLLQVVAAQRLAFALGNHQPTAIVYRTVKGWQYGIEGKASHGAGHKLCSAGFYQALEPIAPEIARALPSCESGDSRCHGGADGDVLEACFFEALGEVRHALEARWSTAKLLAGRLWAARERLDKRGRSERPGAPRVEVVYEMATAGITAVPAELTLAPGTVTTLRGELGRVLDRYNRASGGALLAAAADLLGSTSVNAVGEGFPAGFYHAQANPGARLVAMGGICEDGMCAILSGLSAYGRHIGVASSYAAFLAPLGHIAARLHAIGNQARASVDDGEHRPFFLICAHAGLKTGEDGPTHADPQALQVLADGFPRGTLITLTPWDPQEVWPLVAAALAHRPAVIAPFVTRPNETVTDRRALGLAPATDAVQGVYRLRAAGGARPEGTVVLQESGVTYAFVEQALPKLVAAGVDLEVYYVASSELFGLLPLDQQRAIFPEPAALRAIGITGFTLPTMLPWVTSARGREATLHPFRHGHYLGSGPAARVLEEAGLDGESQYRAVMAYLGRDAR